jgi:hypothetical protein
MGWLVARVCQIARSARVGAGDVGVNAARRRRCCARRAVRGRVSLEGATLHEVARVLRPDGLFVHIGVHPCFCGGFADRSHPDAVTIRPGYLTKHWTKTSWTDQGVRDKLGATHLPLPALLHAFLDSGLTLDRFAEGGAPTPTTLAIRAHLRP